MAEKEERIKRYIVIDEPKIPKESEPYIYIFLSENFGEKTYMNHLPRQEAIERIAKAICKRDNDLDSCLQCVIGFGQTPEMKEKFCKQILRKTKKLDASYMHRAEAALNALLED